MQFVFCLDNFIPSNSKNFVTSLASWNSQMSHGWC